MLDQAYSRRQFLGLAGGLASIVGLGLVGCGGSGASDAADKGSAAAAESVSGEVTYDGASSFQALVEAAAEKFMDANPMSPSPARGNGSGKGLTAVAAGTVTIGNSDVFAETKLEADQVKNLVDHEVAVVGMGPVVSKNVKVDDLSLEQLKGYLLRSDYQLEGGRRRRRHHRRPQPQGRLRYPRHLRGRRLWRRDRRL